MKIAIFHDYFGSIGGGEQVVRILARTFDADVYTTDLCVPNWFVSDFSVASIGRTIPFPGFKQTSALFRFFLNTVNGYDAFICSGNWAHYAAFHHKPVIMYCQDAPVRALYDQYPRYLQDQKIIIRPFFAGWSAILRAGDQKAVSHVHTIIANSQAVRERVNRYYSRDAPVIYPPVDTKKYYNGPDGKFWLSVNRLYPEKQVDIQIELFSRLPELRLIIVGGKGKGDHADRYADKLFKMAADTSNVTLLGEVTEEELLSLYSRCTGLICTARDEAFGITPLEAMASGKPVVALMHGGYLETIAPGCGILVWPDLSELESAIREVSSDPERFKTACIEQAALFDVRVFQKKFTVLLSEILGEPCD